MLKKLRSLKHRLVSWVSLFAEKPYARTTLFLHSFADSSFFPITIDITFIPIAIASPKRAFQFALWATLGSVLGGMFAYYLGMEFMSSIGQSIVTMYGSSDTWDSLLVTFRGDLAEWTLIIASVTPLPFAIATLAAGVAEMDLGNFILICILGRSFRFFALALLIYLFGPAVQVFLDKYSRVIAIVFFISLVLFFLFLLIFKF
ncbi:MAG: cytochrome B [Ignavibacteriae bacterium HGW-Ignavibacteriae-1]|jgi:membrane protein YqaA with SNARE-associated domain|nr:MAG: cytochrome B [Ignavibacteriae bacterium HGW-Ignavibacteriae-1]